MVRIRSVGSDSIENKRVHLSSESMSPRQPLQAWKNQVWEISVRHVVAYDITVDGDGNFVMTYNTESMVRGVTSNAMEPLVKVYWRFKGHRN